MRRGALLLGLAAVLAACGGSALPPPQAGQASLPPAGGSSPGATAAASSGSSGGAPVPEGFSEAEALLFTAIREDARVGCAPRRENLPPKSTAGIECVVGSDLVDRVGVYGFAAPADALAAYIARLAGYGVSLRSGECGSGMGGDRAWTPGDGPGEGGDLPSRIGCFHDENGTANVRVICGATSDGDPGPLRYIGILGTGTDLGALTGWVRSYPEGAEVPVPAPPGICFNDGLPSPD